GDLAQQEVGAQVEDHGHHKGQDEHRNLGVSLGGEQQHEDDDDGHIDHDDADLAVNGFLLGVAQVGGDIHIIGRQQVFHLVQAGQTGVVRLVIVKGHGIQGRVVVIVVGGVVVLHRLHALDPGDLVFQFL